MYQVYIKVELVSIQKNLSVNSESMTKLTKELEAIMKDKDVKYIIEETTGRVNSYVNWSPTLSKKINCKRG